MNEKTFTRVTITVNFDLVVDTQSLKQVVSDLKDAIAQAAANAETPTVSTVSWWAGDIETDSSNKTKFVIPPDLGNHSPIDLVDKWLEDIGDAALLDFESLKSVQEDFESWREANTEPEDEEEEDDAYDENQEPEEYDSNPYDEDEESMAQRIVGGIDARPMRADDRDEDDEIPADRMYKPGREAGISGAQ